MELTESEPAGGKADFGDIYNRPDAREYFEVLGAHEYVIPQHGAAAFWRLLQRRAEVTDAQDPTVLDVCCSYGIGGALFKTDLELDQLYAHYASPLLEDAPSEHVMDLDRKLLEQHLLADAPTVIGIDIADQAVQYGVNVGFLDDGVAENLETSDPSPRLADLLSEVDLITTTGGIGYVGHRTFDRLMAHCPRDPWVAAFCLTAYDFDPIASVLAERGYQTEQSGRSFPQRRFVDESEKEWIVNEVAGRGLDPAVAESDDFLMANFFLARPTNQVEECPLADLIPELA